ncbi:MAG: hypothetical protein RI907_2590 [Pseudomonadota bacterium]|jgi:hypothetical protein
MTTISSGISNANATQWGGPPPRMQRSGEAQQGPSLDELFSKIDSDGDGSISATELKTALTPSASADGTGSTEAAGSEASANSLSGLGLDTQGFAAMMGGGMPPPPPPPAGGSAAGGRHAWQGSDSTAVADSGTSLSWVA